MSTKMWYDLTMIGKGDIESLMLQGYNQTEIAAILGVSRQNINQRIHRPDFNARLKLNSAVKKGIIQKPQSCTSCEASNKLEAHHEDYSKPLEVIWLCKRCHVYRHIEINKKRIARPGKHRYKGVNFYRNKPEGSLRWSVVGKFPKSGDKSYWGVYRTEIEAAKAYNEVAKLYGDEYSYINNIPDTSS